MPRLKVDKKQVVKILTLDISQKTTFSAQHSHFKYTCPGRLCLKEDFTTDPITFISEIFNSDKLALVRENKKAVETFFHNSEQETTKKEHEDDNIMR